MSSDPYRKLVRLVARAFYGGEVPPHTGARSVTDKIDCRGGEAVILLDALTRRQWVKEEDLARDLKLHPKQLRRTLRALEEDQLVVREHRREYAPPKPGTPNPAQGGPASGSTAPATLGGSLPGHVADKAVTDASGRIIRQAVHQFCYCRINYGRFVDVVRFKLGRMRQRLVDDLDENNVCQEYICPKAGCGRRYTALDAPRLIDPRDLLFHCEECQHELELKQGEVELGDAVDGVATDAASALARQRQRKAVLKDLLRRMDIQLKPIMDQLERTKTIAPPDFESLTEFCLRMARSRANVARGSNHEEGDGDTGHGGDGFHGSHPHGGYGSAIPFFGDTQFEVDIDMGLGGGDVGPAGTSSLAADAPAPKELPPWMIREGMVLPSGAVATSSHDAMGRPTHANGAAVTLASAGRPSAPDNLPAVTSMTVKSEVKSAVKPEEGAEDTQSLQERYQAEYVKAYYEAMLAATAAQQAAVAAQAEVDSSLADAVQGGTEVATVTTVTVTQKTEVVVTAVGRKEGADTVAVKEEAEAAVEPEDDGIEWDDVGQGGAIVMGGNGDVMDDVEWEEAAPVMDAGGGASLGVPAAGGAGLGLDASAGAPGEGVLEGDDDDAEWEDA
eukprot:jgi/Mesvir1/12044/Mv00330-RA.1